MPKILVTGGTGFLGSHLLRLLEKERPPSAPRVLVTPGSTAADSLRERGFEVACGSVTSEPDVERAVQGVDQIYHLAGRVSRDPEEQRSLYAVHVEGTRLLCRAARQAGVRRLVLASTSGTLAVTEDGESVPDESASPPLQLIARWPYYASKLYQERAAERECGEKIELVIVNPSLLLGPGDYRLSSTEDVLKFLAREIPVVPPGGLSFVDVRDVAEVFVRAMERGRSGERYLVGAVNWSFEKFFERLARLTKVAGPRVKARGKLFERGAQALDAIYRNRGKASPVDRVGVEMGHSFWYLDATKARRELGFDPRDPGETLYETVAFVRENFLGSSVFR